MEVNELKALESSLIRNMLGINKSCRTTDLKAALGIEPSIENLKEKNLNFFLNLLENEYTEKIIQILTNTKHSTFINEIMGVLNKNKTS